MTTCRIVRIDPVSAMKAGFVLGVLFGACIAMGFMLFAFIYGWVTAGLRFGLENLVLGGFTGVFFGMLYVPVSGSMAWLYVQAYNKTVGRTWMPRVEHMKEG